MEQAPVQSEDLGRSAAKVENLSQVLSKLHKAVKLEAEHINPYGDKGKDEDFDCTNEKDPNTYVVGYLEAPKIEIAKEIDPERIQIKGVPSFDARKIFDKATLKGFLDPDVLCFDKDERKKAAKLPHVKFRANKQNQLALLRKLDASYRLALFPERLVRLRPRCGFFAVSNNLEKDRLILDARPPNFFEITLKFWTRMMGSLVPLLGIYVGPQEILAIYAADLVDWYYEFIISKKRAMRNVITGTWKAADFKDFQCFEDWMLGERGIVPALATLAMGDTNAVEFGMAGHLVPAIRAGVINKSNILRLRGKPPRTSYSAGIIQDDHLGIELEPARFTAEGSREPFENPPINSEAALAFSTMDKVYAQYNMLENKKKAVRRAFEHTAWGARMFGIRGLVSAPRARIVALSILTYTIANLGYSTAGMLEALSGAWINVFMFRRRMLCLMNLIFASYRGVPSNAILKLSTALKTELLLLVLLAPFAVTNMRIPGATRWYAVDASNKGWAITSVGAPEHVVREQISEAAGRSFLDNMSVGGPTMGLSKTVMNLPMSRISSIPLCLPNWCRDWPSSSPKCIPIAAGVHT